MTKQQQQHARTAPCRGPGCSFLRHHRTKLRPMHGALSAPGPCSLELSHVVGPRVGHLFERRTARSLTAPATATTPLSSSSAWARSSSAWHGRWSRRGKGGGRGLAACQRGSRERGDVFGGLYAWCSGSPPTLTPPAPFPSLFLPPHAPFSPYRVPHPGRCDRPACGQGLG